MSAIPHFYPAPAHRYELIAVTGQSITLVLCANTTPGRPPIVPVSYPGRWIFDAPDRGGGPFSGSVCLICSGRPKSRNCSDGQTSLAMPDRAIDSKLRGCDL